MVVNKSTEYYAAFLTVSHTNAVDLVQAWMAETGKTQRVIRMDDTKKFVSTAMKEFCAKHGITMQLVPAYSHLLQCRGEDVIRVTKSHTRVALKQSSAPMRFWAWATRDFVNKKNHPWARPGPAGKTSTLFAGQTMVHWCVEFTSSNQCTILVQNRGSTT
jgi:hypothetical protein